MTVRHFDAMIIGAGQAGGPLARAFAEAGWRTAVVERAHVGGTCINEGCTPTKTMIASARVAYLARRGADYGVRTGDVTVDQAAVRQRKRDIVTSFRGGTERRLADAGVTLVQGEGRFTSPRSIAVRLPNGTEESLTADRIVLNVGERPARPSLPGLADVPALDSTSIMELDALPSHLVVIGGGYIGLEFAQMFRRFGSRVTVVQRGERLLGREDDDVADAVAEVLKEDGIDLLLSTSPLRVARDAAGTIELTVKGAAGERVLSGSHLLVAAGRVPNTDSLSLAAAGIATDARGYVVVNERLETNVAGVWAVGDCKGPPAFTHISYDDFRILRNNLLGEGGATITDRLVPYTVFIDPQLGRVGLTEAQAVGSGRDVLVANMPMRYVARALEMDETRGLIKVVVDAESKRILGASVLGVEGGEIASMLQIAMMGGLEYTALRDAVFPHPGLAESFNNLLAKLQPSAVAAQRPRGDVPSRSGAR